MTILHKPINPAFKGFQSTKCGSGQGALNSGGYIIVNPNNRPEKKCKKCFPEGRSPKKKSNEVVPSDLCTWLVLDSHNEIIQQENSLEDIFKFLEDKRFDEQDCEDHFILKVTEVKRIVFKTPTAENVGIRGFTL